MCHVNVIPSKTLLKKIFKKDYFSSEIPLNIALRLLLTPHLNMTDFHSYQQRSMQSLCFTVQVLALLEEEPLWKNYSL